MCFLLYSKEDCKIRFKFLDRGLFFMGVFQNVMLINLLGANKLILLRSKKKKNFDFFLHKKKERSINKILSLIIKEKQYFCSEILKSLEWIIKKKEIYILRMTLSKY